MPKAKPISSGGSRSTFHYQRKHFEDKLRSVGQLDYFLICVKVRTDKLMLVNDRTRKWNLNLAWRNEAKERWGFHHGWVPGEAMKVPEDAPEATFRETLKADDRDFGKRREAPPNSEDFADAPVSSAANFAEQLRWAQRMFGNDPDKIPRRQIPSNAHLKMLVFANSETERFYRWIQDLDLAEEKTRKTELEFEDDNRKLFKMFDAILVDLERRERREQMSKISTPVADVVVSS